VFAATREIIAYGLIGLVVMTLVPVGIVGHIRRKRKKLRRRGIKQHGH
jgi:hypothetical protein